MKLKLKLNYFVFSAIAIGISTMGRYYSMMGMDWYHTLTLPEITPPKWMFALAWKSIYALTTAVAIIIWNNWKRDRCFKIVMSLFAVNAVLNAAWCYIFFYKHMICLALYDAIAIEVSLIALIILIGKKSRTLAYMLLPYALWVCYAIYLNYGIWQLNG